jgi:hypothetical protein
MAAGEEKVACSVPDLKEFPKILSDKRNIDKR